MKKRRLNLIIGKKQIIIVGLTLILGVAVYVNYLVGANMTENAPVGADGNVKDAVNYGDQTFVSASGRTNSGTGDTIAVSVSRADEYFAQARLDKEESRAEAIEILQTIYSGGDSTETELAVMAQNAEAMSSYVESESKIENVLKAQGFEDVLCYLSENGASVIVKTSGLEPAQAAQIKNALLSEVNIPAEKISILEIN
ncbi:MAG: SpoIIIAH-like family protein [Ruminococcaceae bacterium]|nr:SpoIIIAH-like family protein [Oscillospiraceae bacterium]